MASSVVFTPLSGADVASPPAYLLEIQLPGGGIFTFLLDAGWDEALDPGSLAALRNAAPHIDAVLLSHPDLEHLGALPLLHGRFGLQAPVYATVPVAAMGRVTLREALLTRTSEADFDAFTLEDVDAAFNGITQLRWRQTVSLSGKGAGLSITPFAAGRLVGGSFWCISLQGEDFVYAVDINHRKERLLNGAALEAAASRPALLITDAFNTQQMQPDTGNWEAELMAALKAALRNDGKVLIAVDAAGRVLELLLALERAWRSSKLPYPLRFLSVSAEDTLRLAASQLEWLGDSLQRAFEATRENPFSLDKVKVCSSLADIDALPPGPAVVLAPAPSLGGGPARALLARWATDARNLVVIPGRPTEGSLAAELLAQAARRSAGGAATLQFALSHRVPLQGQELAEHEAAVAAAAAASAPQPSLFDDVPMPESPTAASVAPRRSSSVIAKAGSSGSGAGVATGPAADANSADLPDAGGTAAEVPSGGGSSAPPDVLIEGFTVPEGAAAPMFPCRDEWEGVEWDEYGAAIDPAAFELHADNNDMEADVSDGGAAQEAQRPTKVVTQHIDLLLRCQVLQLAALEGRADGRSQRTIIGHVAPRHLALVRGSDEARHSLAAYCRAELSPLRTTVHVPVAGKPVDVSVGGAVFMVSPSQVLSAAAKLRPVGDYQLGWVAGVVGQLPQDGGPPELLPAPEGLRVGAAQGGVFIGDVRLSDLRRALTKAGMASEWEGPGALVAAQGRVRVSCAPGAARMEGADAADEAALLLEGALCPEYYAVRELLYGQYHIC